MPELPLLLLPALDRLAVGVDTEVEVELLSDPSEAVTTMTVVEVVGVALSVVDVAVLSEEVVLSALVVVVESSEVVLVCAGGSVVVEVGAGAASVDVDDVVVASDVVVAVVEVLDVVADVVSEVEVCSVEDVSLAVVATTVLPLPLASASEPCLPTKAFVSRIKTAALMKKPSATDVAVRAATTSLSTLVECMMFSRVVLTCLLGRGS